MLTRLLDRLFARDAVAIADRASVSLAKLAASVRTRKSLEVTAKRTRWTAKLRAAHAGLVQAQRDLAAGIVALHADLDPLVARVLETGKV